MPTISVVIPTRDRPAFVRQALGSLVAQQFSDFEVVVADNPLNAPCKEVVAEFGDERFRYRRADRPLSMHDNWEAGCAEATGDYVGVMIDKTVWLPSTMSHAMSILEETSASVLSWWNAHFRPDDERSGLTEGDYHLYHHPPRGLTRFSGTGELEQAVSLSIPRGRQGPEWFRGKICFGLYRRDVLERIRGRIGRVFEPISPDYTSRIAALATAPSFVDAGVPLQLSYFSKGSTGARVQRDPVVAKRLLDEIDPGLVDRLPIPGVYTSQHNIVAHDYLLAERLEAAELNRQNLMVRAREDLALDVEWPNRKLRREQSRLLAEAERRAGYSRRDIWAGHTAVRLRPWIEAVRELPTLPYRTILRAPRLHRAVRRVLGKPPVDPAWEAGVHPNTLAGAISEAETQLAEVQRTDGGSEAGRSAAD